MRDKKIEDSLFSNSMDVNNDGFHESNHGALSEHVSE